MNKIPTSVEAQIRTRARNLPVHKCYVNKNWQKTLMANITVIRKHTNGNITTGRFLVDLKLRGVRDCLYKFNESPLQTEENIKRYPELYEECDYNLAHNIIHAGLEFASDYGFEPHKDFKTAQFILEEDTDDIPLMEIPLGEDGVPLLEIRHGETGQREIAMLKKTADENFKVVYLDEKGNPIFQNPTYDEVILEIKEKGVNAFLDERGGELKSDREWQVLNDVLYILKCITDEERGQIDEKTFGILDDPRLKLDGENKNLPSCKKELLKIYKYFEEQETEKAYDEYRKLIDRHPDEPILWCDLLHNLSLDLEEVDEETVKEAFARFPEHTVVKAWYAEWLAQEGRTDEVLELFGHLSGLDALTTENVYINPIVLAPFCFAYAMAWLEKGEILRAEPYYQVIARLGFDFRLGLDVQEKMTDLKKEIIDEVFSAMEDSEPEEKLSDSGQ